ncbi:PREDICTED: protein LURP-one-related 8 [Tarenaya hassleriana]|uniref:protein LURP-one-related 8 n=1 Tax=Tarenaya hassleriana TaxID=28532 RepID=UPI00053C9496|nr:PREDICTED: protein LURP-one-related 8 [Tarenaya hassleriana]
MTKVHPNNACTSFDERASVLTVWKKSLLFNCEGFTVYDGKGNLVFRVDNYMNGHKHKIVLMNASGEPLLTIRRKKLSLLGDCWLVYDGETERDPRFCARKHVSIMPKNSKSLAYVMSTKKTTLYEIEGSYSQRSCRILDEKRKRKAGEMKRKERVGGVGFGPDVFTLVVEPDMDTSVAMALVILLDQMFGSH